MRHGCDRAINPANVSVIQAAPQVEASEGGTEKSREGVAWMTRRSSAVLGAVLRFSGLGDVADE